MFLSGSFYLFEIKVEVDPAPLSLSHKFFRVCESPWSTFAQSYSAKLCHFRSWHNLLRENHAYLLLYTLCQTL